MIPAYQRINFTCLCLLIKISRIFIKRLGIIFSFFGTVFSTALFRLFLLFGRILGNTMRYVIDDIETGNVLLVQKINRLRILLAKDGNKYIGTRHFFFA